ncbi:GNAT family N-acetyltransferase [Paludibacter jiangxiensis]|uniref:Acetyltransferase (GNAT) family protein n=1 Tax=Paludibacter jiangxiensis TaxID=681398 RepID=A0A170ZAU2_9BACT|nr:GNAT family N-acetyltransferase [Paludibacter jiangxiensis]GAT62478.1 acetyltransferase (GNAT) family protein [Paludibacter jiangxiensis]
MTTITDIEIEDCDFSNPEHLNGICDLLNAYIRDQMGGGTPLNKLQQLRLVDGLNNHPTAIVLLALAGERPVGMLVAFENFSTFTVRPMVNIHDLIVLPEFRGLGVGRKLMEAIEIRARGKGCSRITLEVRHDNVKAQTLYVSLDFQEADPPMYYWRKNL